MAMTPEQIEQELSHLVPKEDFQQLRTELILWIIGSNVAVGAMIIGVMLYLNNQMLVILQHWKP
jgi:hypothetical protein